MNKSMSILIKGIIILKSILTILFLISVLALGSEWFSLSHSEHPESKIFIEGTPEKIASMLLLLFALVATLLFDIRTLKQKEKVIYKNWAVLLLLSVVVIAISTIFKIQWLGITLMLLLSFYTIYLLFKFKKA